MVRSIPSASIGGQFSRHLLLAICLTMAAVVAAQSKPDDRAILQEHYGRAQAAQSAGTLDDATRTVKA